MAKALITGINGFTGRYLATELREAGYSVVGIGQRTSPADEINIFRCDLGDSRNLTDVLAQVRPDVVVNLAGISFVGHGDVEAIYRINMAGARNLLEAISKSGCKPQSVLLVSSAHVYGNTSGGPIDELVPVNPASDYAVSKLAMELVARLWLDRLPITIVRPFNYTGVGQAEDFLLPKLVSHFKRRAPAIELGNLDVVRDYSDVRTLVRCYRLLLERRGTSGEVFNICSGVGHSLREVLGMMRDLSGHAPEVRANPAFMRANEVHRLVGSRAKLDGVVGPVANIPLPETLRWMYEAPNRV